MGTSSPAAPPAGTVSVDNEFSYVDGGLIISKFVTGDAVAHAPDQFTVNCRCVAPVLPVTADGTESIENIQFTGSSLLDFFVGSSIWLYDIVAGTDSSLSELSTVTSF